MQNQSSLGELLEPGDACALQGVDRIHASLKKCSAKNADLANLVNSGTIMCSKQTRIEFYLIHLNLIIYITCSGIIALPPDFCGYCSLYFQRLYKSMNCLV